MKKIRKEKIQLPEEVVNSKKRDGVEWLKLPTKQTSVKTIWKLFVYKQI